MRTAFIIVTTLILAGCHQAERSHTQATAQDIVPAKPGRAQAPVTGNVAPRYADAYDSLATAPVDTSTLQGKRRRIMNQFLVENGLVSPEYDTLTDLNYDGYKDYVIGYYGKSGSGIKNGEYVYLFHPKGHSYLLDEQLSSLPNPTFYTDQKKITSFYIGNGGGSGQRLEWIHNRWTTTKSFEVEENGDDTKWKISYPLRRKKEVIVRPFQMIPPEDILETKWH